MQDQKNDDGKGQGVNQSRRKALKKIAVGTAVAGALAVSSKWTKPVVNSVILPAHAQATNAQGPATETTTTTTTTTTPTPTTTANPNER